MSSRVKVKATAKKAVKKVSKQANDKGVKFKAPSKYEQELEEETQEKRPYPANRKPRDYSESSFELVIEDFLPSYRRAFKPELKKKIVEATANLQLGQSIFIPTKELSAATIRVIIKEEMKKPFYKNKDIRVIGSVDKKLQGCRIARYL